MLFNPNWSASGQLLAAADYIEQYGWCQDTAFMQDGRACAIGALIKAKASDEALDRMRDHVGGSIRAWNDAPGRTKDEVIAALRSA